MEVTVLGKRIVRKEDKKTEEVLENCVVHFKYIDDIVEGEAVRTVWVGNRCCPPENIVVGEKYDVFEFNGYVVRFCPQRITDNTLD